MILLDIGVGLIFFALGLILALSKSAKGSTFVTFFLGFIGGGAGGVILGGGHLPLLDPGSASSPYVWNLGCLVFAIGVGFAVGLVSGVILKVTKGGPPDINIVQEAVAPQDKIPPN